MEAARLTFSTFGAFRVTRPDGTDVTPRSQKACGLLALLLDAPNCERSRAGLQDKLWSDRAPTQGAGSLRHALTDIRKALGDDRDVLLADTRMVRLDRRAISADLHDPAEVARARRKGAIFLEGLDVRDPEFDDWIRNRRLALEATAVRSPRDLPASLPKQGDERPPILFLTSSATGLGLFADHVVHSIAKGISSIGAVDVRWGGAQVEADVGSEAYLLDAAERPLGDGAAIRIQLSTVPGATICWQTSEILPDRDPGETTGTLARLINEGVDRTAAAFAGDRLFASIEGGDDLFSSIRKMWLSVGRNPAELSRRFEEHFAAEGRGVHLAWQAFVSCFIVGERQEGADPAAARDLIRRALELEPHNAMVLALASHIYGFVLSQPEVAHDLAERSIRLDRNNALGWTFLGVAKINLGMREEAYRSVAHARQIAGEGPHRPFLDSVAAMVASLSGRGREAINIGETVHALRPDFAAPLRYLLASYLSTGDFDRARLTALRLRELEPDFETSLLAEPDYPVEPLRRSGMLDLSKLPKLK